MELENDATLLRHHWLQLVAYHILVELGYIEFFIPLGVEFALANHLGQLDVGEAFEGVVFWELRLD